MSFKTDVEQLSQGGYRYSGLNGFTRRQEEIKTLLRKIYAVKTSASAVFDIETNLLGEPNKGPGYLFVPYHELNENYTILGSAGGMYRFRDVIRARNDMVNELYMLISDMSTALDGNDTESSSVLFDDASSMLNYAVSVAMKLDISKSEINEILKEERREGGFGTEYGDSEDDVL
mgnify:CR=1 FL=1